MRQGFPLQWPEGWKRTDAGLRLRSRFGQRGQLPLPYAYDCLALELARLGAANIVITTDLPVNSRGIPYASARTSDVGGSHDAATELNVALAEAETELAA